MQFSVVLAIGCEANDQTACVISQFVHQGDINPVSTVPPYTLCSCLAVRNSCLVYDWREGFGSYIAITTLYQDALVVYSKTVQELAINPAHK